MHLYHQMWHLIYFKLTAVLSATLPSLQYWRQYNFRGWWLNSLSSRHPHHLHRPLPDWEGEGLQGAQVQVLRWEESKKGETSSTVKLASFIELVALCATSNLALFLSNLNVRNYKGQRARLATCTATDEISDNEVSNVYALVEGDILIMSSWHNGLDMQSAPRSVPTCSVWEWGQNITLGVARHCMRTSEL